MDRLVEPIRGLYPPRPEWDWLWRSAILIMGVDSNPPSDLTGRSRSWRAEAYGGGANRGRNSYGPAFLFPNGTSTTTPSHGFSFGDAPAIDSSDTWTGPAQSFTVAGVWNDTLKATNQRLFHIYTNDGPAGSYREFLLFFFNSSQYYQWQRWPGPVIEICSMFDYAEDDRRFVVAVERGIATKFYSAGRLATEWSGSSPGLSKMTGVFIGCDYNQKESACLGGTMAPFIICRGVWTADQVARWSADPWGFMRPAFDPVPLPYRPAKGEADLLFDAEGYPIKDRPTPIGATPGGIGRIAALPSSLGRLTASAGSEPRIQASPGAEGRISATLSADGRISARLWVAGREVSVSGACPIPLNWNANNDLKLSDVIDTRDSSPITDAATVEVAIFNLDDPTEPELTAVSPVTLSQLAPPDANDFRGDVLVDGTNGFALGMRLRLEYSYDAGVGKVGFFPALGIVQAAKS